MAKRNNFTPALISWYRKNARDLPWRRTGDPYKIWISEVMLQQTTVNAVIPYYGRWLKSFPDVQTVARAPLQKILRTWQGLGYYQRARNIHKAAKVLVKEFAGQIPSNQEAMRRLPGFGPYTRGAVLSIAFNQREPIIDANVRRVVMRQLALEGQATPTHDPEILKFLDQVMPMKNMSFFNQGLMELGALICRPRQPLCLACPVKETCVAYSKGIQEIIPTPKKSIVKDIHAVVAVIEKNGKIFLQRRPPNGLFADLWEFPGGKIEEGESPRQAIIREVREELGQDVVAAKHLVTVQHLYTQFRVKLEAWQCQLKTDAVEDGTHKWLRLDQLRKYPMPSGSARIVDHLTLDN
ncbi:MAG: A/G-specific adenine glycosylase [Candidatus Omnitrophica bacterium]|nr:A/G-specific adenine glycosylase [Candidatus Omnitrophota bacterium]